MTLTPTPHRPLADGGALPGDRLESLVLRPLPAPLPDPAGLPEHAVRAVTADQEGAFPCRRCLQDARVGEALWLLSYDPFLGDSPYRQPGPIYVHQRACAPDRLDVVPAQQLRRQLGVRAFDADHLMVGAQVIPGVELAATARELLAAPDVAYLHVHNAGPGCFAVRIDRAG